MHAIAETSRESAPAGRILTAEHTKRDLVSVGEKEERRERQTEKCQAQLRQPFVVRRVDTTTVSTHPPGGGSRRALASNPTKVRSNTECEVAAGGDIGGRLSLCSAATRCRPMSSRRFVPSVPSAATRAPKSSFRRPR